MIKSSALILTYNEEMNITECIESINTYISDIVVLDSGSTDNTINICKKFKCRIYTNKFVTQMHQINWAIKNIDFKNEWIMRVDADERWSDDGLKKFNKIISDNKFDALYVKIRIFFRGKYMRFGGQSDNDFLRAFKKNNFVNSEQWMDEHIAINGKILKTKIYVDEKNYDRMFDLTMWISKHNKYSIREVIQQLENKLNNTNQINKSLSKKVELKHFFKNNVYILFPDFFGPLLLFLYRYFILLGFLDGIKGFQYAFLQSLWYRYIVNIKLKQYLEKSNNNLNKALQIAKKDYLDLI